MRDMSVEQQIKQCAAHLRVRGINLTHVTLIQPAWSQLQRELEDRRGRFEQRRDPLAPVSVMTCAGPVECKRA